MISKGKGTLDTDALVIGHSQFPSSLNTIDDHGLSEGNYLNKYVHSDLTLNFVS